MTTLNLNKDKHLKGTSYSFTGVTWCSYLDFCSGKWVKNTCKKDKKIETGVSCRLQIGPCPNLPSGGHGGLGRGAGSIKGVMKGLATGRTGQWP